MRRIAPVLAALVLAGAAPSKEEPLTLTSPATRVPLLELFTSEGCSSCPPAEEWLSGLRSDPRLWKEVVPVAFHVDYWDYIGWKDPLAAPGFTARQLAYVRRWGGGDKVYTPGFVFDGREWTGWSDHGKLPPVRKGWRSGVLSVRVAGPRRWEVAYSPVPLMERGRGGEGKRPAFEAHAALLGMGIVIDVLAGENRGRRLRHDFAVVSYASALLKDEGKGGRRTVLELPAPSAKAPSYAMAVWVTHPGREPIQAVGGFLPAEADSPP